MDKKTMTLGMPKHMSKYGEQSQLVAYLNTKREKKNATARVIFYSCNQQQRIIKHLQK